MKRPQFEQEQARKIKTRFRMLQHAQKISHKISQHQPDLPLLRHLSGAVLHLASPFSRRRGWKTRGTGPAGPP